LGSKAVVEPEQPPEIPSGHRSKTLPPVVPCKAVAAAKTAKTSVTANYNCNVCVMERHLGMRTKNSNSSEPATEEQHRSYAGSLNQRLGLRQTAAGCYSGALPFWPGPSQCPGVHCSPFQPHDHPALERSRQLAGSRSCSGRCHPVG